MHKKINILIIDDNQNLCELLYEYFSTDDDFNLAGVAHNGVDALNLIKNKNPDIIILDIVMPNLDGIGVLEELNNIAHSPRPKIIVLSSMNQEMIAKHLYGFGVDYYILKPFDLNVLSRRIKKLFSKETIAGIETTENQQKQLNIEITNVLHQMRVPNHIKGFRYTKEAVLMLIKEINLVDNVSKEIYSEIAEKYMTTPVSVERAIRHAITIAWEKGDMETINKFFGNNAHIERNKPTNAEFIARIADKVRVSLKN